MFKSCRQSLLTEEPQVKKTRRIISHVYKANVAALLFVPGNTINGVAALTGEPVPNINTWRKRYFPFAERSSNGLTVHMNIDMFNPPQIKIKHSDELGVHLTYLGFSHVFSPDEAQAFSDAVNGVLTFRFSKVQTNVERFKPLN